MQKPKQILKVNNLSILIAEKKLVDNISFSINEGSILGLVGESGSGKTLTSLAIPRLLAENLSVQGEIYFKGMKLNDLSEKELQTIRGLDIGMIFQEPLTALNPLHRIEKQIREAIILKYKNINKLAIKKKIIEMLNNVRFPLAKINSYVHELSGGERQRAMIAMALINRPSLIIADEPTTALDANIQLQILELLKRLQKEFNLTIIFISHDIHLVAAFADDIIVMRNSKIVEKLTARDLKKNTHSDYTKQLLRRESLRKSKQVSKDRKVLLATKDLAINYPIYGGIFRKVKSHVSAVKKLNIELYPQCTLGVLGESGSGKSSLALAILRLIKAEGECYFNSKNIFSLNQKQLLSERKNMQIVFQDPFSSLSPRMSVIEIITEGLDIHFKELSPQNRKQLVIDTMASVGLDESFQNRYPHEFSGGQRQRIAIARALILKPKLLILDEPTSSLDRITQRQILDLLEEIQNKYKLGFILISHDISVIRRLSDHVLVLKEGNVMEYGKARKVLVKPKNQYVKNLIASYY